MLDPDPNPVPVSLRRKVPVPVPQHCCLVQVAEQSQAEDPLAMSIAGILMSRPGSVMDGDR
jgi:hypothetical protein